MAARSYQVRVDPGFWIDVRMVEQCSRTARSAYFGSLFYLASVGEPAGLYPHNHLASEVGSDALTVAQQLVGIGAWEFLGLGYRVLSYAGCAVVAEQRAPISAALRALVFARDGHRCRRCASTHHLALDHIYPWSRGGPDTEENLQVLCRSCNSSKGAKV